jgi:hypothetical protein
MFIIMHWLLQQVTNTHHSVRQSRARTVRTSTTVQYWTAESCCNDIDVTPANITQDPCKYYLRPLQILLRTPANIT